MMKTNRFLIYNHNRLDLIIKSFNMITQYCANIELNMVFVTSGVNYFETIVNKGLMYTNNVCEDQRKVSIGTVFINFKFI